jgi:hypothetical protein
MLTIADTLVRESFRRAARSAFPSDFISRARFSNREHHIAWCPLSTCNFRRVIAQRDRAREAENEAPR